MNINLEIFSFSVPICLSGCTARQAFLYIFFTSLAVTSWCIPHSVHLAPAQMILLREQSKVLMFLALPSLQSYIFASSGSIDLTSSLFFIAPIVWFWVASLDVGLNPPNRSSKVLVDTLGLTPPVCEEGAPTPPAPSFGAKKDLL